MPRNFVSRWIIKGDDQSARAFQSVERSAGRLITRFAAFAGVGLSLDAVIGKTKEAIRQFDNIAKTADKIGVSTDALQELRHAAELNGVAINTADMALQRFVRRTAEAAEGTGEAKAVLEKLDIQLRDNAGRLRSADALLSDVADKLANVEDQGERVRIAFKLFDSEGVQFVNVLQRGSGALDDMRREARDLGIVIEEKMLRESERMNDELTRASEIIDKNLKRAFLNLAPPIVKATQAMADFTTEVSAFFEGFERIQDLSDTALDRQIERAERRMADFREEVDKARDSFLGLLSPSLAVSATVAALQTDIDDLRTEKVRRDLLEAFEAVEPQVRRVRDIISDIRFDLNLFDDAGEAFRRIFFAAEAPALPRAKPEFERDDKEREREAARIEAHRRELQRIQERFDFFAARQDGEIEIIRQRTQSEQEILREAFENDLISREEFNARRLQLEADFWNQVRNFRLEDDALQQAIFDRELNRAVSNSAAILATFGQHFKELHFLEQASAISNTVMRTIESVQAALTVPPPAGWIFAAINAAAGAANVASIAATSFGSTGKAPRVPGAGAGGGGGGPRANPLRGPDLRPDRTPRRRTEININVSGARPGQNFTTDDIRELIEGINEAVGDGFELNIRGL